MKLSKTLTHTVWASAGFVLLTQTVTAQFYTAGHADIGVGYEDEGSGFELHPHWHTHPGAVIDGVIQGADDEFEAGDLIAIVAATREGVAPTNAAFNTGTGTAGGSAIWTLPQSNIAGVPFLGIGAEELTNSDWVDGEITFALGSVVSPTGSGDFSVYQVDGLGAFSFFMSTADIGSNGGVVLTAGDHDHYNWAFTEAGTWSIDIIVSGTHVTDGFQIATETFTFQVVPEPSSYAALTGLLALAFVVARRRAVRS